MTKTTRLSVINLQQLNFKKKIYFQDFIYLIKEIFLNISYDFEKLNFFRIKDK